MGLTLAQRTGTGLGLGGTLSSMGGAGASLANVPLIDLLKAFKQTVVTGAAANTDITLTGIAPGDIIIGAIAVETLTDSPGDVDFSVTDKTSVAVITAKNKIQFTSSTADNKVIVTYIDVT